MTSFVQKRPKMYLLVPNLMKWTKVHAICACYMYILYIHVKRISDTYLYVIHACNMYII